MRLDSLSRYGNGPNAPGLLHRSITSPYLFSGLLKCGQCGGNLVIGTGGGSHRHPKYVCSNYYNRGTCKNNLFIRHDDLESRLLKALESQLLQPQAIDYAVDSLTKILESSDRDLRDELEPLKQRQAMLQHEIRNLSSAIAVHGHSAQLLAELAVREKEFTANGEKLNHQPATRAPADAGQLRRLFIKRVSNLRELLNTDVVLAKSELRKHVNEVRMVPESENGRGYYVAEGNWKIMGVDQNLDQMRQYSDWRIRMVAGVRFELTTFGL